MEEGETFRARDRLKKKKQRNEPKTRSWLQNEKS